MKMLRFSYKMQLQFDDTIREHSFTLKCIPADTNRQKILELHTAIYPHGDLEDDRDSFGNICIRGYEKDPHDHFSVAVTGVARTGLSRYEAAAELRSLGKYKYPTYYTQPGKNLCAYYAELSRMEEGGAYESTSGQEGSGNYVRARRMMEALYRDFRYVSGATRINTSAEEAWTQGAGVCQDYSHIMISLCQMAGIPARYVVGMLVGEGLSHAWVEIMDDGHWIGLDPTNNLIVDQQHIKISSGRDYHDCTINQGRFTGTAGQTQQIAVSVQELAESTQSPVCKCFI